jgi:hypothetical protein
MRRTVKRSSLVVATFVLVAACGNGPPYSRAEVTSKPSSMPASRSNDLATASPTQCGRAAMAVDRGPYVIAGIEVPGFFPNMGPAGWQKDDLALRQVVVVGRIVTKEAAAFGGQAHVYTPFTVEVERVIHGVAVPGPTRVSIEGGSVGCYEVNVDTVPRLELGARYVLFLTGPAGSDPPPEVWDAWVVDDRDVVWTYQGSMSLAELVDRIDRLASAQSSTTP